MRPGAKLNLHIKYSVDQNSYCPASNLSHMTNRFCPYCYSFIISSRYSATCISSTRVFCGLHPDSVLKICLSILRCYVKTSSALPSNPDVFQSFLSPMIDEYIFVGNTTSNHLSGWANRIGPKSKVEILIPSYQKTKYPKQRLLVTPSVSIAVQPARLFRVPFALCS